MDECLMFLEVFARHFKDTYPRTLLAQQACLPRRSRQSLRREKANIRFYSTAKQSFFYLTLSKPSGPSDSSVGCTVAAQWMQG